jgi:hypothetical protein
MSGLDTRRQLELDVGGALNDVEAVESFIDNLLTEHVVEASEAVIIREAAWARHHIYQARIIIDRVFTSMNEPCWDSGNALTEMKKARELVKFVFPHVISTMPDRRGRSAEQDRLLDRIGMLGHLIECAIRSIEVRRLEQQGGLGR